MCPAAGWRVLAGLSPALALSSMLVKGALITALEVDDRLLLFQRWAAHAHWSKGSYSLGSLGSTVSRHVWRCTRLDQQPVALQVFRNTVALLRTNTLTSESLQHAVVAAAAAAVWNPCQ